jgi:tetratricopeptide (TPR) repeat protein
MGLFGRIFGSGNTVDKIRSAFSREEWATVLSLAEAAGDGLTEEQKTLVGEMTRSSGDQLASLNLEQAEACIRAEDFDRAGEHLDLALGLGRSDDLRAKARELLEKIATRATSDAVVADNCTSCKQGSERVVSASVADSEIEPPAEAWELTLAALPPRWAASYGQLSDELQQAVLLAHAGLDAEARQIFLAMDEADHCDVSRYELASLYLRSGDLDEGTELLKNLLLTVPDHDLALQLAIDLAAQQVQLPWLPPLLNDNLANGVHAGLSHAGLARLAALHGDDADLLKHSRAALQHGYADQELLIWTARLLEQQGHLGEAEALLRQLPGGAGCSGGANPLLGEFWLRNGKKPDQALESFKNAARQDPENPRWALRIAQCYLHKGWKKECGAMLQQILRTPQLDQSLREEALASQERLQGS